MVTPLRSFCHIYQPGFSEEEQNNQAAQISGYVIDVSNYLESNKALFPKKIVTLTRDLLSASYREGYLEQICARKIGLGKQMGKKHGTDHYSKSFKFVTEELPKLEEELNNEFRKMLGVDENNEKIRS